MTVNSLSDCAEEGDTLYSILDNNRNPQSN